MPTKTKGQQTRTNGNGQKTSASKRGKVALVLSGERMLDKKILIAPDSPRPYGLNRESAEQREKRLAKRKALTLKAFGIAYNNHHTRKAS